MTYYLLNLLSEKVDSCHGINVFPSNRILWVNRPESNPFLFHEDSSLHESKALPLSLQRARHVKAYETPPDITYPWCFETFRQQNSGSWGSWSVSRPFSPCYARRVSCSRIIIMILRKSI